MLHRHCVPRSVYDDVRTQLADLTEKYHALKLQGAAPPAEPKPGRVVPAGPSPEALASKRMHDQLINDLASDIEQMPGVSPELAKREAARLREIAMGGSVLDPPV